MSDIIYIAAGGPSLKNFNWRMLEGKRVIAVNRSYEKVPNAEIIYFSDLRFFEWNQRGLLDHSAEKITGSKLEHSKVTKIKLTGMNGLDLNEGCIKSGNNSGYAAINLAIHKGAKTIVLLGFDMKFAPEGDTHWHNGYVVANRERQFTKMLPCFDTISEPLRNAGVSVYNACPDSAIKVFPKITLDEAIYMFSDKSK